MSITSGYGTPTPRRQARRPVPVVVDQCQPYPLVPMGLVTVGIPTLALASGGGSPGTPNSRIAGVTQQPAERSKQEQPSKVLVYSDDATTRSQVMLALGKRPHPDLAPLEYVEVATEPVVIQQMDTGTIDLAILDGEAVPAGGMGIAKQLKDEIYRCPPILVLTGRPQDAWLATWSRAEAAVPHPIDPMQLADAVVRLLRMRLPAPTAR
jgi:hypothetical protein